MKIVNWITVPIVIVVLSLLLHQDMAANSVKRTIFHPAESNAVLNNPYMGFSIDARYDESVQPHRLAHANVTWRELEPVKGQFDFDAFEDKNNFAAWREKGVNVVLRIILDYPGRVRHMDIPDWLYEEIGKDGEWYNTRYGQGFSPDYTHPKLIENHERLIRTIAEQYNEDSLIAFVQLGSIGHWGEWHTYDDEPHIIPFPKRDVADQYVMHYLNHFTNKNLLMRRPTEIASQNQMGLFNDSFGDHSHTVDGFYRWINEGYTSWLTGEKEPAMPDFWKTSPSGGEFASKSKFFEDEYIEATLEQARMTHVSFMGPQGPYTIDADEQLQRNIDAFLKTIGYRFVIVSSSHESEVPSGKSFSFLLNVHNKGVAPFYFRWPVELSLSDQTGQIHFRQVLKSDIRKWLPGRNITLHTIQLPKQLKEGLYTVNIAIINPETNEPGIQFANEGMRSDGRYSLGKVTVTSAK